jgi:hypothetical protein
MAQERYTKEGDKPEYLGDSGDLINSIDSEHSGDSDDSIGLEDSEYSKDSGDLIDSIDSEDSEYSGDSGDSIDSIDLEYLGLIGVLGAKGSIWGLRIVYSAAYRIRSILGYIS